MSTNSSVITWLTKGKESNGLIVYRWTPWLVTVVLAIVAFTVMYRSMGGTSETLLTVLDGAGWACALVVWIAMVRDWQTNGILVAFSAYYFLVSPHITSMQVALALMVVLIPVLAWRLRQLNKEQSENRQQD